MKTLQPGCDRAVAPAPARLNPTPTMKLESIGVIREVDTSPDTSYLGEYSSEAGANAIDREARGDMGHNEYRYFNPANAEAAELDYQRSETLNRGEWCYLLIHAAAVVHSERGIAQTVTSGYIGGIESDSGEAYLAEIETEQLAELRKELEALGIEIPADMEVEPVSR